LTKDIYTNSFIWFISLFL